jgi:hypothetical protein
MTRSAEWKIENFLKIVLISDGLDHNQESSRMIRTSTIMRKEGWWIIFYKNYFSFFHFGLNRCLQFYFIDFSNFKLIICRLTFNNFINKPEKRIIAYGTIILAKNLGYLTLHNCIIICILFYTSIVIVLLAIALISLLSYDS